MPLPNHAAISSNTTEDACRIIIIDDSLLIRRVIARIFENDPAFKVVATAGNGQKAISALEKNPADVVLLDIDMPVMDGLTALPQLKAIDPAVQIIMVSTLTQRGADVSLRALSLGATDYIPKPSSAQIFNTVTDFSRELTEKSRTLGFVARRQGVRRAARPVQAEQPANKITLRPNPLSRPDIIAIGCSTGGPQALFETVKEMGGALPQPVVITQHMPPSFTAVLAKHITHQCQVACTEAQDGEVLNAGHYYIAPGDYHLTFARGAAGTLIKLNQDPPENYCRPSVDLMLRSLAEIYGRRALAVILTGMGQDGLKGCETVVNAGGAVIAQDKATSVVWGMPGVVATAGLCSSVLPLNEIGKTIRNLANMGPA